MQPLDLDGTCQIDKKNDIFGILASKAFDWYSMGPIRGGGGGPSLGGGAPNFFWATFTEFLIYHRNPELKPSRLAPFMS